MTQTKRSEATLTKTRVRVGRKPSRWRVVMLNDEVTTMDFVVHVLTVVFQKNTEEAVALMFQVHEEGSAICGVYSRDIAETKIHETRQLAQKQNFPLNLELEELS